MKQKTMAQIVTSIIALAAIVAASVMSPAMAADSYPLETTDPEVADALDYLRAEQGTDGSIGSFVDSAWIAMAIAAAGEDPHDWQVGGNSIVVYLAANAGDASLSTDYSRMILAIVASGEDPTDYLGV